MTVAARRLAVLLAGMLIATAGAAGCGRDQGRGVAGEAEGQEADAAEYAVMSALLREEVLEPDRPYVLIRDSTAAERIQDDPDAVRSTARSLRVPASLVRKWIRLNAGPHPLRPAFSLGRDTRLISRSERDSLINYKARAPGEDEWKKFSERYPRAAGVAWVSRIAFTPDGRTALASYGMTCGFLCGEGGTVRMDRVRGEWKVTAHATLWVS